MTMLVLLVSFGVLLYVYAGYPLVLELIVWIRGARPIVRGPDLPRVSLIIGPIIRRRVRRIIRPIHVGLPRRRDGSASYRPASSRGKHYQRGPKRQWPIAILRITATMMNGSNENSRTTAPTVTCQVASGGSGIKSGAVDPGVQPPSVR